MQEGLATEEADVANTPMVENLESSIELLSVDPSNVFSIYLSVRKVAEIAESIARVRDRDIAQGWSATTYEAHHVQGFRPYVSHDASLLFKALQGAFEQWPQEL